MIKSAQSLSADWINSLPTDQRENLLKNLKGEELEHLLRDWRTWARIEQLPPQNDWRIWLYIGGRGTGKTRAGAEWIADGIRRGTMRRIALIGATYRDARAVMIEGASGLLGVSEGAEFEPSNLRVLWPSGEVATVLSAEDPDGIRGHQFDAAWGDEFCKWHDPQGVLDMLQMALRIGEHPRVLLTTTPRNIPALKDLFDASGVEMTQGTTKANEANLAPGFLAALESRYAGTRLGRQELDAEIIADVEGALWKREWIERTRLRTAPELDRVVVAVDPPGTKTGCECGIVVVGQSRDGAGFVLADHSAGGLTPKGWAERAAAAYRMFEADCIVAEVNQGGDMVKSNLHEALPDAPVREVWAKRGKMTRAGLASHLYESGRVHHVGVFPELEDQLCNYEGKGDSPDRLDALVWALTELFPGTKKSEPRARVL